MLKRWSYYIENDLWRIRIRHLPKGKYFFVRFLRVSVLAFQGFNEDKCQLKASALTYYSMLSIVPLLAMAFGIAKGFGFQSHLESWILTHLQGQEQVAEWVLKFSNAFLANVNGGLFAGVGVGLLFWTVVKVLNSIEQSFNDIWGVKVGRSWARKASNYLSIMLVCPVLLIASSSMTVFITAQIALVVQKVMLLGKFSGLIFFALKMLPYAFVWITFSFIYAYLPNTKVSFKSGLLAGVISGTFYQVVQWAYIFFQVGMTKYNAVYGSFAALPLFLVWLEVSWLVMLFGAEVSFAMDHEETYEFERDALHASPRFKKLLALRIVEKIVKNFRDGGSPVEAQSIADATEAPIRLVRELLYELVRAGVLAQVMTADETRQYYQPAKDIGHLTIRNVINLLERSGQDPMGMVKEGELDLIARKMDQLDQVLMRSSEDVLLKDL